MMDVVDVDVDVTKLWFSFADWLMWACAVLCCVVLCCGVLCCVVVCLPFITPGQILLFVRSCELLRTLRRRQSQIGRAHV